MTEVWVGAGIGSLDDNEEMRCDRRALLGSAMR